MLLVLGWSAPELQTERSENESGGPEIEESLDDRSPSIQTQGLYPSIST